MNILSLPAFTVLDTQQDDLDLHFTYKTVAKPSFCPCCSTKDGDLAGYGRNMQLSMDTPKGDGKAIWRQ